MKTFQLDVGKTYIDRFNNIVDVTELNEGVGIKEPYYSGLRRSDGGMCLYDLHGVDLFSVTDDDKYNIVNEFHVEVGALYLNDIGESIEIYLEEDGYFYGTVISEVGNTRTYAFFGDGTCFSDNLNIIKQLSSVPILPESNEGIRDNSTIIIDAMKDYKKDNNLENLFLAQYLIENLIKNHTYGN